MSVQPPPTNTTTPVYNPIFFIDPTASSGITIPFLDANYLKFPTAQGSEDFTNGLFSTDTIDFNSATGANRAITNLSTSSFSDILGNATYTASIEENSTAIGAYDGGLVITSSNTINLVGADVLLNGVPITTGGGDVFLAGNNTFTGSNYFDIGYVSIANSTGSFPTLPSGYSQFLSYNDNPWFSSATIGGGVQLTTSTNLTNALASYALLASPTFTGNPRAPTSTAGDSSTNIATTAFVATSFATKASPALTGNPTAPTQSPNDNSTKIATTAYTDNAVSSITGYAPLNSPVFTGNPTSTTNPPNNDNSQSLATTSWVLANTSDTGLNTAYPSKAVFGRTGFISGTTWTSVALQGSGGGGIPYYQALCFLYVPDTAPMNNILLKCNYSIAGNFGGTGPPPQCISLLNWAEVLVNINVSNYSSNGSGQPQSLSTDYNYAVIEGPPGFITSQSQGGYNFTPFQLGSARVGQMIIYFNFPQIPTQTATGSPYPTLPFDFVTSVTCSVEIINSQVIGIPSTYNDFATFPNNAPAQNSFGGSAYLEVYQG